MKAGPTINRHRSSGVQRTPPEFVAAVEGKFGPLTVDLAATYENAKAAVWITPERDSLTVDWHKLGGLLWLNPPYNNITIWAKKCYVEWLRGADILLLVPMGSQNWYWDYVEPFADVYCVGRMKFGGHKDVYPKDLILAHYHNNSPQHKPQRWLWKGEKAESKRFDERALN